MKVNATEFLSYAQSTQFNLWETKTGIPFEYRVVTSGIRVLPSTGSERSISNSQIVRFCELFNETQSFKVSDYNELFNKSYLVSIMVKFNVEDIDFFIPEEVFEDENLYEGNVKKIQINAYERNAKARAQCIEIYGTKCCICDFDFGDVYGDYASGFIHVHHIVPLSSIKNNSAVNPGADLRPVCPNCHAVIHLRKNCLSIKEVKNILKKKD